uniref:Protein lifeguard 3 (Trinotate prediction) n=1 Tax=Myxobolus squamalis TaxID=59785 RepID=A0A6B2G8I2_MYXSQ
MFLILFSCQTRIDFTGWGPYLMSFLIGLMIFGIFSMLLNTYVLSLFYSYLCAILFSFYIIYDVQNIMGGRKNEIHESEYVLATFNIYIDAIYLFLFVLGISGSSD